MCARPFGGISLGSHHGVPNDPVELVFIDLVGPRKIELHVCQSSFNNGVIEFAKVLEREPSTQNVVPKIVGRLFGTGGFRMLRR